MVPGFGGKLDDVQWPTAHRVFAQNVKPRDVGAVRIDALQNLDQLIVVVVLELEFSATGQAYEKPQGQKKHLHAFPTKNRSKEPRARMKRLQLCSTSVE